MAVKRRLCCWHCRKVWFLRLTQRRHSQSKNPEPLEYCEKTLSATAVAHGSSWNFFRLPFRRTKDDFAAGSRTGIARFGAASALVLGAFQRGRCGNGARPLDLDHVR